MSRGRAVPPRPAPRQAADSTMPVMTVAEVAGFLASRAGAFSLAYLHDEGCPAGNGSGRGCNCTPDVYLSDHRRRLIAEVKP